MVGEQAFACDQVVRTPGTALVEQPIVPQNDLVPQVLGVTQEELDTILGQADRTSLAGGGPWDGITVINGDLGVTGGTGTGLLYVTGDMTISGNFSWRGLIYVEGDLRNTGISWVLGAVVVAGEAGVDFAAGTPSVLYSRDMLIQALTGSMHYIVLSWKEL